MKWMLILLILTIGCATEGREKHGCVTSETRCTDLAMNKMDFCNVNQEWQTIERNDNYLCYDVEFIDVCLVDCEEGEIVDYLESSWECVTGDLCADAYFEEVL